MLDTDGCSTAQCSEHALGSAPQGPHCAHRHFMFQLCLLLKSICYFFHSAMEVSGSLITIQL